MENDNLSKIRIAKEALIKIANWNSHTTEFAINNGSNGTRDLYREVARAALQDMEFGLSLSDAEIKRLVIENLTQEYSIEAAKEQVDKAKITVVGNVIAVQYENNVVDNFIIKEIKTLKHIS